MELGLAGKVVVVPASSHGLSRAVALAFAREGARVAMCSGDGKAIDAAAAEVRDLEADVLAVQADLRNPSDTPPSSSLWSSAMGASTCSCPMPAGHRPVASTASMTMTGARRST